MLGILRGSGEARGSVGVRGGLEGVRGGARQRGPPPPPEPKRFIKPVAFPARLVVKPVAFPARLVVGG